MTRWPWIHDAFGARHEMTVAVAKVEAQGRAGLIDLELYRVLDRLDLASGEGEDRPDANTAESDAYEMLEVKGFLEPFEDDEDEIRITAIVARAVLVALQGIAS